MIVPHTPQVLARTQLLQRRGGSARHRHRSRAEWGRKTPNARQLFLADYAEALHSNGRQHQGVLDSELFIYVRKLQPVNIVSSKCWGGLA